ncbi:MAG TPA: sulfatase-like hydrolase/transferase [Pirellulaceae bacterium]|nr:sulfatase-like hydrolase/transferase [Pirellulaceae bacterium]
MWKAMTLVGMLLLAPSWCCAAERPNILWLTSEDHGPEMGCYGDKLARTPNVDDLASRGMLFDRAWSCAPVCAPARSAIISGIYPSSSGGLHMRSMVPLPAKFKLFPQLLRESGYYCTNNAKEDYNVQPAGKLWDVSNNKAHWKQRAAGQPFFAVFNSTKSHESQLRTRPHELIADPSQVRVPAYHPDTPEVRQDWAQYYDKVSEADADAGARLKELADAGLAEETIIFYYGDHGSGMPRSKRWPGNSGLHVPLVVYFPEKWRHLAPQDYKNGGKSTRLVSFVDFAPTVLSLAGIQPLDWLQGRAWAGKYQVSGEAYLFGERGRMDECYDMIRSVTDGRYVYLRNYFPQVSQAQHVMYQFETPTTRVWHTLFEQGKTTPAQSLFWQTPKAPEELYDLHADRDEVHNLAKSAEHQEVLARLRKALRDHILQVRDVCFLPEGELHARAEGSTPYEMAHDAAKYPLLKILTTAELASDLTPDTIPTLLDSLTDDDNAVRYWAAMGLLMRGGEAVTRGQDALRKAMKDPTPLVRIVTAEALAQHGSEADLPPALAELGKLADPEQNDFFTAIAALGAVEALGPKAKPLHAEVARLKQARQLPHARYSPYIPRLVANITGGKVAEAPTRPQRKPMPTPSESN